MVLGLTDELPVLYLCEYGFSGSYGGVGAHGGDCAVDDEVGERVCKTVSTQRHRPKREEGQLTVRRARGDSSEYSKSELHFLFAG